MTCAGRSRSRSLAFPVSARICCTWLSGNILAITPRLMWSVRRMPAGRLAGARAMAVARPKRSASIADLNAYVNSIACSPDLRPGASGAPDPAVLLRLPLPRHRAALGRARAPGRDLVPVVPAEALGGGTGRLVARGLPDLLRQHAPALGRRESGGVRRPGAGGVGRQFPQARQPAGRVRLVRQPQRRPDRLDAGREPAAAADHRADPRTLGCPGPRPQGCMGRPAGRLLHRPRRRPFGRARPLSPPRGPGSGGGGDRGVVRTGVSGRPPPPDQPVVGGRPAASAGGSTRRRTTSASPARITAPPASSKGFGRSPRTSVLNATPTTGMSSMKGAIWSMG